MAGVFYPRMGRIPNDEKGGRHELIEGVPGFELLVRWTFCATGDVTCDGARSGDALRSTPAPTVPLSPVTPAPVVPRLGSKQAQVEEGKALIPLICGGSAACEGQLELLAPTAKGAVAARGRATRLGSAGKGKAATVVYGKASYKLAAGAKGKVTVKLNRRGKKLLAKRAKATVTLRLAPKGGTATTAKLTLKRAARRSAEATVRSATEFGAAVKLAPECVPGRGVRGKPAQGRHVPGRDGTGRRTVRTWAVLRLPSTNAVRETRDGRVTTLHLS